MKEIWFWCEPSLAGGEPNQLRWWGFSKSNSKYEPQGTSGPNVGAIGIIKAMRPRQMVWGRWVKTGYFCYWTTVAI